MRAREFISESIPNAKISKRKQYATRGLDLYGDSEFWNADYTQNRLGMAVACTDGKTMPDIDAKSWVGKNKTAHPYTDEEREMLRLAYKAVGASHKDLNDGDMRSMEPPGGNTTSPIASFKGYPR
jgi:hypothetical protein